MPESTIYEFALIQAGSAFPGAHVCESEPHDLLMRLAREHSQYQAERQTQGHQGFQQRFETIYRELGLYAAEICAETWDRQEFDKPLEIGTEMFRCWKGSPGHWRVASERHRWFGASVARGMNGIWYATIIVAD